MQFLIVNKIWTRDLKGMIYSSAIIAQDVYAIATYEPALWILDPETSDLRMKIMLPSIVFSSPSIYGKVLVCCTVDGVCIWFNIESGLIIKTISLPGEVFSSPVIVNRNLDIVVGCRDNYCYYLAF